MYVPQWLEYDQEQRSKLAEHFELKRTRSVEVLNNTLISDGYDDKQIYAISIEEADELLGLNKNAKDEKSKEKTSNNKGNKGSDGAKEDAKKAPEAK